MEQRGKNTNNTLTELESVLSDIESGKCLTDGYSGAIADIKEDIAQLKGIQLTVEQAAYNYAIAKSESRYESNFDSFKAGAEWQQKHYEELLLIVRAFLIERPSSQVSIDHYVNKFAEKRELLQD